MNEIKMENEVFINTWNKKVITIPIEDYRRHRKKFLDRVEEDDIILVLVDGNGKKKRSLMML